MKDKMSFWIIVKEKNKTTAGRKIKIDFYSLKKITFEIFSIKNY